MTIRELKEKRAGLLANMRALDAKADAEKRNLNTEEKSSYDAMESEFDSLTAAITRKENLAAAEANLSAQRDDQGFRPQVGEAAGKRNRMQSPEYRAAFDRYFLTGDRSVQNALETGVDSDGGFLVPEEYEREIIRLQTNIDPMRMLADVRLSRSFTNIPVQTNKASFAFIGENGTYPRTNPKFGRVSLSAHKVGGFILASDEILTDPDADVAGFIASEGSQAAVDVEAPTWYVGTGAAEPLGLFNTTSVGGLSVVEHTGAVSATATITADDLLDTVHTLPVIRRPRSGWLLADATLKAVRKLKAHDNQYIWQPGITAGQPDRLLGYPVYTSDYAPAMAVSTRSIAFGDFKAYRIHDRLGMEIKRYDELFGETGQIGWRFTKRTDGKLLDAKAVVFFKHGAAS